MPRLLLLFVALLLAPVLPAQGVKRPIRLDDLPPATHRSLASAADSPTAFDEWREATQRDTAERQLEGENDHLIFYLLQSSRFSQQPRIEPAGSARDFAASLNAKDRARFLAGDAAFLPKSLPGVVRNRVRDLVEALERPTGDERLGYFQQFLSKVPPSQRQEHLTRQYVRVMRDLVRREQTVGRSRSLRTDTQLEGGYAPWLALDELRKREPGLRVRRVLVVGPGLDFAPRTELVDLFPPQSYQPFALEDRLLALDLVHPTDWSIHCVDINDRVVRFFRQGARESVLPLQLLLSASDARLDEYFRRLGDQIGVARTLGLQKRLEVRGELARRVTADKLDVVTERYEPSPGYDLIVATSILEYFEDATLLTALSNMHAMLRPGGYVVHNDFRPQAEQFAQALGLPAMASDRVEIRMKDGAPMRDGYVILRKRER